MRWFKHSAGMRHDTKVRRVVRRYKAEGYALYNYILESVAEGISVDSPLPVLEETSEDIAEILQIDSRRVEEIIRFMVTQRLVGIIEGTNVVVVPKMIDHLDEYSRKKGEASPIRRALNNLQSAEQITYTADDIIIDRQGQSTFIDDIDQPEPVKIQPEKPPKSPRFKPPTIQDIKEYKPEIDAGKFHDFYESKGWMIGKSKMKDWKAAARNWARSEEKDSPVTKEKERQEMVERLGAMG